MFKRINVCVCVAVIRLTGRAERVGAPRAADGDTSLTRPFAADGETP